MKKEYAEYILKKTKENYNLTAEEFSRTRQQPWPELEFLFSNYLKDGESILDLGCGNGRYYEFFENRNIKYIGVDNSEKLIEIAKNKYDKDNFILADSLNLPFVDNSFNKIYSIAVLHHFPSKEIRNQFLVECRRVLKPDGLLVLTVWKFHRFKEVFLLIKYTILKILGLSKLDFKDIFEPWGKKILRYYHWFSKRELAKLLEKNRFIIKKCGIIRNQKGNRRNIYIICQKPS